MLHSVVVWSIPLVTMVGLASPSVEPSQEPSWVDSTVVASETDEMWELPPVEVTPACPEEDPESCPPMPSDEPSAQPEPSVSLIPPHVTVAPSQTASEAPSPATPTTPTTPTTTPTDPSVAPTVTVTPGPPELARTGVESWHVLLVGLLLLGVGGICAARP